MSDELPAPDDIRRHNDEVFFAAADPFSIRSKHVDFLKAQARRNVRRIARLCLHPNPGDRQHEMLIVNLGNTYIRPHLNTGKTKSFLVVEGSMAVAFFDLDGKIESKVALSAFGAGHPYALRIQCTRFHTVRMLTPCTVFHEQTVGPFTQGDTVFASWAPEQHDAAGAAALLASIDSHPFSE